MKQKVMICERSGETLKVLDIKTMTVQFDEETMTVSIRYNRKDYELLGTCFNPYIIIK